MHVYIQICQRCTLSIVHFFVYLIIIHMMELNAIVINHSEDSSEGGASAGERPHLDSYVVAYNNNGQEFRMP